jgi:hypothetical protein
MSDKPNPIAEFIKANPYQGPLNKGIRDNEKRRCYEIYFEDVAAYTDSEPAALGYHLFRADGDTRVVGIRIFKEALP